MYTNCLNSSITNVVEQCDQCLPHCDRVSYQIRQIMSPADNAEITLQLDSVEYREKMKSAITDLLGGIGGVLGLWLGLDFYFLIRVFFSFSANILRVLWKLARRKNSKKENRNKMKNNEGRNLASKKSIRNARMLETLRKIADAFDVEISYAKKVGSNKLDILEIFHIANANMRYCKV